MPRHGYPVLWDGQPHGTVTSGAPSPTLGVPIAMAYVEPGVAAEAGNGDAGPGDTADGRLAVDIRGRAEPADDPPAFLPATYSRSGQPATMTSPGGPARRVSRSQESDQMTVPENLNYTAEHEWVTIDGTVASVGITDYAQQALGDVVYVSVPAAGSAVTAGEPCGEVESTKSVSDLYSPVDGEVIEANPEIDDDPGLVNTDPYGSGWLLRIRLADDSEPGGPADRRGIHRADQRG